VRDKHKEKEHSKLLEMALPDAPDDGKEEGEILEDHGGAPKETPERVKPSATAEDRELPAPELRKEEGELDAMDIDAPTPAKIDAAPAPASAPAAQHAHEADPDIDRGKDLEEPVLEGDEVDPMAVDEQEDQETRHFIHREVPETLHPLRERDIDHDRYFSATFKLGDKRPPDVYF
jgi:hypothetical protein